ncbi:MAG: hypothetical protein JST85_20085 [Acidobacteria bacterium]|nr:hypothetical protein [Acidobacteriota bacterium]
MQNIIRAVIVNGGEATDFCARFLDTDDKPIKDITISLGEVRAAPAGAKPRRQPAALPCVGSHDRIPSQK